MTTLSFLLALPITQLRIEVNVFFFNALDIISLKQSSNCSGANINGVFIDVFNSPKHLNTNLTSKPIKEMTKVVKVAIDHMVGRL